MQNNLGKVPMPPQEFWEGSAFSQIEPAMAYLYGLPLLLILEADVEETGFFQLGQGPFLRLTWDSKRPLDEFFGSIVWKEILRNWVAHVRNGYYIQTEPEFKYSCNNNNE